MQQRLICENCVNHCRLLLHYGPDNLLNEVTGNSCPGGVRYAEKVASELKTVIQATVKIEKADIDQIKVKTAEPVSMNLKDACFAEIEAFVATAPVKFGDVLIRNIGGSGIDLVAAQLCKEKEKQA